MPDGLFLEPENYLPCQLVPSRFVQTGERRLAAAILEDAMKQATKRLPNKATQDSIRAQQEARDWIASEDEWIVSFESICSMLECNASWVRQKVFELIDKQIVPARFVWRRNDLGTEAQPRQRPSTLYGLTPEQRRANSKKAVIARLSKMGARQGKISA